jgi:ubiquinol-cytochrome c reductase iron-sulfur subunit
MREDAPAIPPSAIPFKAWGEGEMAAAAGSGDGGSGVVRRDFLYIASGAIAGVGAAASLWPFVDSLNPSADVLALSSIEVDISQVPQGQAITVLWRGKPVFVRHRTKSEIDKARVDDKAELKDKALDSDRVKKPEWLVMVGVCTHLGCVPLGQKGDFGGWFCPCHGSHYDTSGRIRKGPAPKNLDIPQYTFVSDSLIRIG